MDAKALCELESNTHFHCPRWALTLRLRVGTLKPGCLGLCLTAATYLLALALWAGHLTSLCLSFLIWPITNNSACLIKLFWRSKEVMCRNLEYSWLHHKLWKWMSRFPSMSLICPEWWEMQFYPSLHSAPSSWWSHDARLCSKSLPESKFRWDPLRPATPSSPFLRRWVRGSELTQLFQDKPTQTQGWMIHT